eukprot:30910-Pelagococcus_subviridis.AAC.6
MWHAHFRTGSYELRKKLVAAYLVVSFLTVNSLIFHMFALGDRPVPAKARPPSLSHCLSPHDRARVLCAFSSRTFVASPSSLSARQPRGFSARTRRLSTPLLTPFDSAPTSPRADPRPSVPDGLRRVLHDELPARVGHARDGGLPAVVRVAEILRARPAVLPPLRHLLPVARLRPVSVQRRRRVRAAAGPERARVHRDVAGRLRGRLRVDVRDGARGVPTRGFSRGGRAERATERRRLEGVERRRGWGLKARDPGRRETPGEVLEKRRSPRRRGRTGTGVRRTRLDATRSTTRPSSARGAMERVDAR